MSREIKFRAWDTKKKYFESDPLILNGRVCYFDAFDSLEYYKEGRMVLQQYTGLKDKNGKEIYEGDILSNGQHIDWIVEFDEASFKVKHVGSIVRDNWVLDWGMAESREVIGNIWEDKSQ